MIIGLGRAWIAIAAIAVFVAGPVYQASATSPKLQLPQKVYPQVGKYVTNIDGDLYYDGQLLKLWGINWSRENMDYQTVDNLVQRLRNTGHNALRLWTSGTPHLGMPGMSSSRNS